MECVHQEHSRPGVGFIEQADVSTAAAFPVLSS